MQVALLPLDDRPISYLLPKQIADFSGIDLVLLERKYLGNLKHGSDLSQIEKWLKNVEACRGMPLLVSLDNWVYGGLVQSRKHSFSLEELKNRVEILCTMSLPLYGFTSIMRIPNYNNSDEEKDYWEGYGEKIFKWSELMHKVGKGIKEEGTHEELIENWYQSSKQIPAEILADYKSHRDKNLTINLLWLESLHKDCFKYLIFSCDDSAKYGMNVVEAEYLKKTIRKHNFIDRVKVISGTDEVPLILFTKAVTEKSTVKPSLSIYFNSTSGKNNLARYESNTISESILNQIDTIGIEVKDLEKSDIALCVHIADSVQGDHIFKAEPSDTKENVSKIVRFLEEIKKPFILLDLAYANGSDPNLIDGLLKANINWELCYGYAGWNTCSNSTGSALAIGINRWISEKKNVFKKDEFKKCLLVRFLDDYAYQTQIRYLKITEEELNDKIKPYVQIFSKLLGLNGINVSCTLPWKRSFEVEINI